MSTEQNSELFAIKHTNSPIGEFAAQAIIISFVQSVFFFDLFRYDIRNYFSVVRTFSVPAQSSPILGKKTKQFHAMFSLTHINIQTLR